MTVSLAVALLLTVIGMLVGIGLGVVWQQRQQAAARGSDSTPDPAVTTQTLVQRDEQLLALAESRFREAGMGVKGELETSKQAVAHLVEPIGQILAKLEAKIGDIERERLASYTSLTEQVRHANLTAEALRHQTAALVTALKSPQARGQWGEMQLRRVMEIAGMVAHCDFDLQVSATTADGAAIRPDAVVHLPGGKSVVIDAKVPLASYLEAAETTSESERVQLLSGHSRALRNHVDALAKKQYWTAFAATPEFVVLFIPGEAFLAPALTHDPSLLDDAMSRKVIIATPTTLLATLRSIGYAWQQEALTANAKQVFDVGRSLYQRLATMGNSMTKLGTSLSRAVDHYNATVGTLEKRVFVDARRMADLGLTQETLQAPDPIEAAVRPLTAPELLAVTDLETATRREPRHRNSEAKPLHSKQKKDHETVEVDLRDPTAPSPRENEVA